MNSKSPLWVRILAAMGGVLLLASLIFFGFARGASAEEDFSTDETMRPFEWPDWAFSTFDPAVTPAPPPTAAPQAGQEGLRESQASYSATHIYAGPFSAQLAASSSSFSYTQNVYYKWPSGTSNGLAAYPPVNRIPKNDNYLVLDEDEENPETFMTYKDIMCTPFGRNFSVNVNNGAYVFCIKDYPDVSLNRGYSITYTLGAGSTSPTFGPPDSYPAALTALGYSDSYLIDNLTVQIVAITHYNDGSTAQYTIIHPWASFAAGVSFTLEFKPVDRTNLVNYIDIIAVVNPGFRLNELYDAMHQYYVDNNLTPAYGTWFLTNGFFKMGRVVDMSDAEYNRSWWQESIFNWFVPDPDHIQAIIDAHGIISGDTSGLSNFAVGFRSFLDDSLSSHAGRSFIISFPEFSFPINGQTYTFWNGYNFDWAAFLNSSQNSQLKTFLWVATDFLFAAAFANSMIALFVGFYDMHLWQGVSGGGEED